MRRHSVSLSIVRHRNDAVSTSALVACGAVTFVLVMVVMMLVTVMEPGAPSPSYAAPCVPRRRLGSPVHIVAIVIMHVHLLLIRRQPFALLQRIQSHFLFPDIHLFAVFSNTFLLQPRVVLLRVLIRVPLLLCPPVAPVAY
jgi:hypothetical protein